MSKKVGNQKLLMKIGGFLRSLALKKTGLKRIAND